MSHFLLAIDQGTTSSRAILFDQGGGVVKIAQRELEQFFPQNGWVEHDGEQIWADTLQVCRELIQSANITAKEIAGVGITNQRETTLIWDRATGKPIAKAIVWQDRRTAELCRNLAQDGYETMIQTKTGLLLDPYFSASKIKWLLDNVDGARLRAERGELAFGTVDCYLLWKLTSGQRHQTDASNASRTMLFNIHSQQWDQEILDLFAIPAALLPEVKDCCDDFGEIDAEHLGHPIPIGGIAGDQQAALIGQACFNPGMAKSTYGTGCFMIVNTGDRAIKSDNRLLTTVAYRLEGKVSYGIEGSIFVAGAALQWLRDGLKIIHNAVESEQIAQQFQTSNGVYLVPAFTGLGAPYWDADARGAMIGLTRDTQAEHIVVAALQSAAFQSRDLLDAIQRDGAGRLKSLRVDGGMVANNWLVQCLADTLQVPVTRPLVTETTALGAAFLAGLKVGIFESLQDVAACWQPQRLFEPQSGRDNSQQLYDGWLRALARVRS